MTDWKEQCAIVKHLAAAYHSHDLCLFLGAGISRGCGLPDWVELLGKLFVESYRGKFPSDGFMGTIEQPKGWGGLTKANADLAAGELKRLPLHIQGRHLKRNLAADFSAQLQQALYSNPIIITQTLVEIGRLGNLRAICTYNFDDLAETKSGATVFEPVFKAPEQQIAPGHVPVYHVHGYVPFGATHSQEATVVLSEDDYHSIYAAPYSWSNMVQLSLLTQFTALFIGVSFADPNQRRILDTVRQCSSPGRLFALMKYPSKRLARDGSGFSHTLLRFHEDSCRDLGVKPLWLDDFEPDIPIVLSSLVESEPARHFVDGIRQKALQTKDMTESSDQCQVVSCGRPAILNQRECKEHYVRSLENDGIIPHILDCA